MLLLLQDLFKEQKEKSFLKGCLKGVGYMDKKNNNNIEI